MCLYTTHMKPTIVEKDTIVYKLGYVSKKLNVFFSYYYRQYMWTLNEMKESVLNVKRKKVSRMQTVHILKNPKIKYVTYISNGLYAYTDIEQARNFYRSTYQSEIKISTFLIPKGAKIYKDNYYNNSAIVSNKMMLIKL